jgi:hypothetical protein
MNTFLSPEIAMTIVITVVIVTITTYDSAG